MRTEGTGRASGRFLAAATALLFDMAACEDGGEAPLGPEAGTSVSASASQTGTAQGEEAFYYYDGRKIFLETVAGQFVVKAGEGVDPTTAARDALAELGLDVNPGRALGKGHRALEVPAATAAQAEGLAQRLHDHPDLTFASPVYHAPSDGSEILPLNSLMVMFEEGVTASDIQEINEAFGTTVVREPVLEHAWRYHILGYPTSGERSVLEIVNGIEEHPLTEWADFNRHAGRLASGTAEPFFDGQWYLDDNPATGPNGDSVDINIRPAWDVTTGDSTVTVVVIDSGIDGDHEDLEASFGEDFATAEDNCGGLDELTPKEDVPGAHGTSVAGIIAAEHNGTGIAGIAPGVTLRPIRVFCNGMATSTQDLADAIGVAWEDLGAEVINNSWSLEDGATDDGIANAVEWALIDGRGFLGSVVVFSSGNQADNGFTDVAFPANLSSDSIPVIAVSAIDSTGALAGYSQHGPEIDLTAPSSFEDADTENCVGDIVTTDIGGLGGCDDGPGFNNSYTSTFGGTSAAAPQVSGAAALLLSMDPDMTASEVRQALKAADDDWGDPDKFGAGKLNVGTLFETSDPDASFDNDCGTQIIC